MDAATALDWNEADKLTKKRRLPIAIFRRLKATFTPRAFAAGRQRGLTIDEYRRDRGGVNGGALDEIVKEQIDELYDLLTSRRGEIDHHLRHYLIDLWRGADPWRGNQTRHTDADEAAARRTAATRARELSAELRRIAGLADAVALGFDLRGEDYEHRQRLSDFVDAVRGRTQDMDVKQSSGKDQK